MPSNTSVIGYELQLSGICGDHGICVKHPHYDDQYQCSCHDGYDGDHCELSKY